ncbi:hypothetical protein IB642_01890 [Allofrancisella guangzhouensis]|uniref:Uncharacterized protein n=1 Tax=Allofrancisella guangzhouensis TaxID=594679 RepID=A0A0A8E2R1_9GAMM|nr:hypothetical protein [Allofrancisella guangzhouensis]AJC48239.1 hypothetical protein SD28_00450 [Allofrancisella guangzhouensis]MBK2027534.1 hypothetical protein [Allofrancisella guangzhouensis]MBK2043769.1 hypothetical protein [Allofrancisella guangzhouensis]MBK2045271.1 hypothetical protein [Allofrancisella guangzhouensis]
MIDINKHRYNYFYNYYTVVRNLIPSHICERIVRQVDHAIENEFVDLVDHQGLGTDAVSDLGGRYLHHIFKGEDS